MRCSSYARLMSADVLVARSCPVRLLRDSIRHFRRANAHTHNTIVRAGMPPRTAMEAADRSFTLVLSEVFVNAPRSPLVVRGRISAVGRRGECAAAGFRLCGGPAMHPWQDFGSGAAVVRETDARRRSRADITPFSPQEHPLSRPKADITPWHNLLSGPEPISRHFAPEFSPLSHLRADITPREPLQPPQS